MNDSTVFGAAERLIADACTPAAIREIEAGGAANALWQRLHESGFMDALVPADANGAGLSLSEAFALFYLCGRYAVPVPLAQTALVRALLAAARADIPEGPITIADAAVARSGPTRAARAPYGRVAEWVLADADRGLVLLPVRFGRAASTGVHGSLEMDIEWPEIPGAAQQLEAPLDARTLGACLYAAQLAGAMARVLDITARYANERSQFGRPIAKFQAIQHQLSVMAEHVTAARLAAQIACHGATHLPSAELAALGKARTSEAAVIVASIGHAVHGAMGFTAAYELQLYTRRLHEWRLAYGSEAYWTERIGAALLESDATALEFIRTRLFPARP